MREVELLIPGTLENTQGVANEKRISSYSEFPSRRGSK